MNKLNYEILDAIDSIEECTYQAEQEVFNSMMNEYKKSMMLLEYVDPNVYDEIIYQESSSPKSQSKIGVMISKIWEGVKNVFGFLVRGFKWIIDKLVSVFRKTKKTASQIAEESLIIDKDQSNQQHSSPIVNGVKNKAQHMSKSASKLNNKTTSIKMEVDPSSEYKPDQVQILLSDITCKFGKDGEVIIETPSSIKQTTDDQMNSDARQAIPSGLSFDDIFITIKLINHIDMREKFFDIFKEIFEIFNYLKKVRFKTISTMKSSSKFDELLNVYSLYYYKNDKIQNSMSFKLKDLQIFSKQLSEVYKNYITPVTISDIQLNTQHEQLIDSVNRLFALVELVQYSLNTITGVIKNSYTINKQYFASINNVENLDKFVSGMIDAGIPSKYVGYNAWLASGPNIHNEKDFKPKWGQGRLTLFPDDKDIVYKIGLNASGVMANKIENNIYNKLSKPDILCPCLSIEKGSSVITMKRVDSVGVCNEDKCNELTNRLNDLINSQKMQVTITDIHEKNIGKINNEFVVIDYGCTMIPLNKR